MELIGHALNYEDPAYVRERGALYNYRIAGNGVFLEAQRSELSVQFRISKAEIRGLEPILHRFEYELPPVPLGQVERIIERAQEFAAASLETLFHLSWSDLNPWNDGWIVEEPEQDRTAATCRPLEDGGSHDRAIIEIHSHHSMAANFSRQDDLDETGFRIYGVIGRLPKKPEIRMRVGVYGYFYEIPASWVMELPEGLKDCNREGE